MMGTLRLTAMMMLTLSIASVSLAQENGTDTAELPIAKPTNPDELPVAKPTETEDSPVAKPSNLGPRPLSVTITLANQSVIRGTLTDTTEIQMKTGFGELTIPLSEVAGVRFASQEDTTTAVVMLNGDSVTGATDVKMLMVETEWGNAQINGSGVASILLVPNLQWSSVAGLNGKRWYLTEANIAPTTTNGASTSQQSSNSNSFVPNGGVRVQSRPFGSR